jgi:hypothetical protein
MTIFSKKTGNPYALIPLFVFYFTFWVPVLYDYAFPSPIAVLIGIAVLLFKSSTDEKSNFNCRLRRK